MPLLPDQIRIRSEFLLATAGASAEEVPRDPWGLLHSLHPTMTSLLFGNPSRSIRHERAKVCEHTPILVLDYPLEKVGSSHECGDEHRLRVFVVLAFKRAVQQCWADPAEAAPVSTGEEEVGTSDLFRWYQYRRINKGQGWNV